MQAPGSEIGGRFGPYELRALLGRGGMSEVYEAYDTVKGRVVALKLLSSELLGDAEYQTRFRRESQAAARLAEPHVIPIHDWGVIEGRLFIDMRLVVGSDLRAVLQSGGPLAPERAVSVVEQIAAALDAAHTDGLVHRDVKPGNILLTDADFAYLADFGIAHHASDTSVTRAGVAVGSYAYMAPERFERVPVTGRVDVYSLACVLHECLTGEQPFDAPSLGMLIRAHMAEPPPRASLQRTGLSAAFDEVIAHGMAKNPHDRFASAGEFAVAARTALNSPARPPQAPGTAAAESSPQTGGIPTLVVRIPTRDEDGAPDQTTTLPAIIPDDPTSVRPTELQFTPLTEDEPPGTEAPGAGIRPFPDAHLYQDQQLHPAADPTARPDSAPATGGMPVADFYPPDQATRIYGAAYPGAAADEATRGHQRMPDPDGHPEAANRYPYGPGDGSDRRPYPADGHYGAAAQPYGPGDRPGEYGPAPDEYGYRGDGPDPHDVGHAPAQYPSPGPSVPGEYGYPSEERMSDAPHADGHWWTAAQEEPDDRPPVGPPVDGGHGPARPAAAHPEPDPYAAAYEAGYRDSYLANAGRAPVPQRRRSPTTPLLAGAGVFLLVVLLAVVGFAVLASGSDEASRAAETTGAAATTSAARSSAPAAEPSSTTTSTTTAPGELPSDAHPCTTGSDGAYGSAAAGTAVTSCEFAEAVRQAYLDPDVVYAPGEPVSVEATSPVTGQVYTLECVAEDDLVTCSGGNNAVVYLY